MATCSFILVAGACGDYLDLADNIIVMANYKAECAKIHGALCAGYEGVCETVAMSEKKIGVASSWVYPSGRILADYIRPIQNGIRPTSAVERQVKVKLNGENVIQIGFLVSDTHRIVALADKQQRLGAGFILLNLCQNIISNGDAAASQIASKPIVEAVRALTEKIKNVGFRNLPQGMSREMSLPRPIDIACVLFRLRDMGRK